MQKIVADALRPEDSRDPYGVDEARATLDRAYALLDDRLTDGLARRPGVHASPTARPRRRSSTRTSCTAGTRPRTRASPRYFERLTARPSVARVIDEARPYREVFPLPWPAHVT